MTILLPSTLLLWLELQPFRQEPFAELLPSGCGLFARVSKEFLRRSIEAYTLAWPFLRLVTEIILLRFIYDAVLRLSLRTLRMLPLQQLSPLTELDRSEGTFVRGIIL